MGLGMTKSPQGWEHWKEGLKLKKDWGRERGRGGLKYSLWFSLPHIPLISHCKLSETLPGLNGSPVVKRADRLGRCLRDEPGR